MTRHSLLAASLAFTGLVLGCGSKKTGGDTDAGSSCPPPTIAFHDPANGATVGGPVAIKLDVTNACPIDHIDVSADGQPVFTLTTGPWAQFWDTTTLPNSNVELHAVAVDTAGQKGEATINVIVQQPCNSQTADCPPRVRILTPDANATVCGKLTIYAEADDDRDTPQVTFSADGQTLGTLNQGPYLQDWDATSVAAGDHVLEADAKDSAGHTMQYKLHVQVAGQCTPQKPVVAFACPPPDPHGFVQCATGMEALCVDARSPSGIASVAYQLNGAPLGGTPAGAQWTTTWDTTTYAEGTYQLKATATDKTGASTSESEAFTIDRSPPTIQLTPPPITAPVGQPLALSATTADGSGCGVAKVSYEIKGPNTDATIVATVPPFSASWDTTNVSSGTYTITATATDRAGLTASDTGTVMLLVQ